MPISPTLIQLTSEVYQVEDQDFDLGDQDIIGSMVTGGNDVFNGANNAAGYQAIGDANELQGTGRGGNDRFVGGSNSGGSQEVGNIPVSGSGDSYTSVVFVGDAATMWDNSVGGNDSITGGTNSENEFYGDALDAAYGSSRGGNDTITGSHAIAGEDDDVGASNYIVGDSEWMYDLAKGGADSLTGGSATTGLDGYAVVQNVVFGDSYGAEGATTGGADRIFGGNANASDAGIFLVLNMLSGDSYYLEEGTRGGADTMQGGNLNISGTFSGWSDGYALNMMTGDANYLEYAIAGADTMTGGGVTDTNTTGDVDGYALNLMAGDAFDAYGATYAADKLTGGSAAATADAFVINEMFGDSGSDLGMVPAVAPIAPVIGLGEDSVHELYANDQLFGGNGLVINAMIGDARELYNGDVGGNDKITAGNTVSLGEDGADAWDLLDFDISLDASDHNLMVGDAEYLYSGGQGGNDTLISGTGNDVMFGDAIFDSGTGGADRFVFKVGNGEDSIGDFSVAEGDKIDLTALKYNPQIRSFAGMNAAATDRIVSDGGSGTIIHLDTYYNSGSNTVHLVGVLPGDLTPACFVFG